jgi:hypothetical protein
MEIFSLIGIIIAAIVIIALSTILSKFLKIVFYALLVALVLVVFFGISYTEIFDILTNIVLLAF